MNVVRHMETSVSRAFCIGNYTSVLEYGQAPIAIMRQLTHSHMNYNNILFKCVFVVIINCQIRCSRCSTLNVIICTTIECNQNFFDSYTMCYGEWAVEYCRVSQHCRNIEYRFTCCRWWQHNVHMPAHSHYTCSVEFPVVFQPRWPSHRYLQWKKQSTQCATGQLQRA